ncbi:MAG: hypothetical protein IPK82_28445 [Polyangiaceae bacterium]|nr:hypothetical protein [Polyangiaceae bacterium]
MMQGSEFDEAGFFRALSTRNVRALLIGRRALVVLGAPVLTADYDLWIHSDDVELLNAVALPFDLVPNHSPDTARARGRYVLENDERVDVLVARRVPTHDGDIVEFDDVWQRRQSVRFSTGERVTIPAIIDLIRTKKWAMRAKDLADIEMLQTILLNPPEGS